MRNVITLVLVSVALLILLIPCGSVSADKAVQDATPIMTRASNTTFAPEFRGGLANLGISDQVPPEIGSIKWTVETEFGIQSSPVYHNGTIICGSDDGVLWCVNESDGGIKWTYTAVRDIQSTPCVADGDGDGTYEVYVGDHNGIFHCIDADTGKEEWEYVTDDAIGASPKVLDGVVYIGSLDKCFYTMHASNGTLIWKVELEDDIWGTACIEGDFLYVGDTAGWLYKLWISNGTERWRWRVPDARGDVYTSVAFLDDKIILGGGPSEGLYCLNAEDASDVWTMQIDKDLEDHESAFYSSVSICDGFVYMVTYWYVYCIPFEDPNSDGAITTDEIVWKFHVSNHEGGSSTVVTDGKVVVGSEDHVHCFDAATGTEIWNVSLAGRVVSSPLVHDESVYIGSQGRGRNKGKLYCVRGAPAAMRMTIIPTSSIVVADTVVDLKIKVTDTNAEPLEGVYITLTASDGEFVGEASGSVDVNGERVHTYKAPLVDAQTEVVVNVKGVRSGYPDGSGSVTLTINPPIEVVASSSGIDQYIPYIIALIVACVLNLAALVAIVLTIIIKKKRGG